MAIRVLVCGDREWKDRKLIFRVLDVYLRTGYEFQTVIEGEARGVDRFAAEWARTKQIAVAPFPADWVEYGLAAGAIRNTQMLDEGEPDMVVAFHDDLEKSRGTRNMLQQAHKRQVMARLHSHSEPAGRWWPGA